MRFHCRLTRLQATTVRTSSRHSALVMTSARAVWQFERGGGGGGLSPQPCGARTGRQRHVKEVHDALAEVVVDVLDQLGDKILGQVLRQVLGHVRCALGGERGTAAVVSTLGHCHF